MPVDEIRPGLRGVGRSVFRDTTIEEFQVEFLGVLRNALGPRQDLILARLTGDPVDTAGVIAGMSGSPVYVDGRLVGAVSYRIGAFAKEAVAGITPIHDMLRLRDLASRAEADPGTGVLESLAARLQPGAAGTGPAGEAAEAAPRPAAGGGGIEPIRTPLVFSGFRPEVLEAVAPFFEARGFLPVLGGGAAPDPAGAAAGLEPGAPVAGQLVTGDMSLAATGTVTWREGDQVLAFGHPFLQMGPVEIPMATARVLHVLPSALGSFKISVPGDIVGRFRQDRLTAIYGEFGALPEMIPVELAVEAPDRSRAYRFELFRNPVWTPGLLLLTLGNAMVGSLDFASVSTIQATTHIRFDGYEDLEYQDVYASLGAGLPLPFAVSLDIAKVFSLLYGNLFEEPVVREIKVKMETVEDARFAVVTAVRAPRFEVEPGEEIPVEVLLVPYRGEVVRKIVPLKVPENTPPGPVVLLAGGHSTLAGAEGGLLGQRLATAESFRQMLRILGEERRSDRLYVRLYRRVSGAVVRSEVLTDLPPSVYSVLDAKQVSQRRSKLSVAAVQEAAVPTDWIIVGGQRVDLTVK
ncbi:MAG: hypothetical protein HY509_01485 [Acidobacteria bacterium]|nr:hypothetical protein [Acidobacteriota bacterium]